MNLLESLFKSATDPATPLHVGEVMSLWTYLAAIKESRVFCQVLLNHTNDTELGEFIQRFMKVEESQADELEQFLRREGVSLPPASVDKPCSDQAAVPAGAKFTDEEIANLILGKMVGLLGTCGTGMIESVRDDVGALFYRYQGALLTEGYKLKKTMQSRGWLRMPPYYYTTQGQATDCSTKS